MKNSTKIAFISLSAATIAFGIYLSNAITTQTASLENVKTLQSGVMTCSYRLSQTFGAWNAANTTAASMTKSFVADTEACYAEVINQIRNEANAFSLESAANSLATDVHWLGQNMGHSVGIGLVESSNNLKAEVINKFSEIEISRDDLLDRLDQVAQLINSDIATNQTTIWLLAIFGIACLVFIVSFDIKDRRELARLEAQASELLLNLNGDNKQSVNRLLQRVLKHAHAPNSAQLISEVRYYDQGVELRPTQESVEIKEEVAAYEEINIPEIQLRDREAINFSEIYQNTFEKMSSKFFAKGILVDQDINSDYWLNHEHEDIEQLIYATLSFAQERSAQTTKKIKLSTDLADDELRFCVEFSRTCFNSTELEVNDGRIDNASTQLDMIYNLAHAMGARVRLANNFRENGEVIGCYVEIAISGITTAPTANREVVDIVKGTKRELQERFRSSPEA